MAATDSNSSLTMRLLYWIIVLSVLLSCSIRTAACIGYCSRVETSGTPPPTIPNTFQTKIEMKNGITNTTTDIQLWNQFDAKLSRLHIEQDLQQFDLYYSFNTQEIFYVQTRTLQCMVFNMSTGGDLDIIIGHNVSGIITPDDSNTMFRLNSELGIKHMPGDYTIRGVRAQRWYSCQSWDERGAEFEVNWYFSDPNWNGVNSAVPLRIEVEGWSNRSVTPNRPFKQIYDFLFFRPYLQDSESVFQTPRGVFCSNRVKTKKLPKLSPILIFTSEKTIGSSEEITAVQYSKMAYDTVQNVVSFQYREPGSLEKAPFYNMGSLTVLQDFNSGVVYFIDNVLGNCSSMPIGTELLDVTDVGNAGWHLLAMKNQMELLAMDGTYQYEGEAMIRGLPVDVFISLRSITIDQQPLNVTAEYYILQDSVTEIVVGPGKVGLGHSVPVEFRIVSYTEMGPDVDPRYSYFERFNFFNFDSSEEISEDGVQAYNYDIGTCYNKEQRLNFLLKFKPEESDVSVSDAMNETELFIRQAVKAMSDSDLGLVNSIRYQHPRLDADDKFVYLLVTLLDKPDVYSLFARVTAENQIVSTIDSSVSADNERDCLNFCYSSTQFGCSSVAFCTGPNVPQKNCLTSSLYQFKPNTNAYTCNVYVRPTNASTRLTELSLESAWSHIQSAATTNSLRVPVWLPGNRQRHFVGLSAEIVDVRFDVYNPLTGRHLKQFDRNQSLAMKTWRRQLDNRVSADDCALACLDETEFDCLSVTYCYDLGICYVNDKAIADAKDDEIVARARCDVFSVNALSKYTELPGKSRVRHTGKLPAGNGSVADCARLCTAAGAGNNTGACRSFDACQIEQQPTQALCYLTSSHLTDSGGVSANATDCTHYSKTYEADFAADTVLVNPVVNHMLVKASLTHQQCARVCAEDQEGECQGFYYCDTSDCVIRGVGVNAAVQGEGGDSGRRVECQYWRRVYSADGTAYRPQQAQTGPPDSKGVSVGAAVAIYIACSLVGAVLGPAVLVAVMHAMGKSTWRDIKAFATRR